MHDKSSNLFPGEHIVIKSVTALPDGTSVTIEPRTDTKTFKKYNWPKPLVTKIIANEIIIPNDTEEIIHVKKNEHICQIRTMTEYEIASAEPSTPLSHQEQV